MKTQVLKAAFLFAAITVLPFASKADVCNPADPDYDQVLCDLQGPGSGGPGGGGPAPAGVPVDGGASLLMAAGAAYAVRRFRKQANTEAKA